MAARIEKDVQVYVTGGAPGTSGDEEADLHLSEGDQAGHVIVHAATHGSEVSVPDLRDALDKAEQEFTTLQPSVRPVA